MNSYGVNRFWLSALLLAIASGCGSVDRGDSAAANATRLSAQAAAELPADRRDAILDQADALLKAEKFEEAYSGYLEVLKHDVKDARALVGMSEAYLGSGNLEKALAGFEQVEDHSPLSAVARQGRGLAFARLGKFDLALKELDHAVRKDPRLWRAWNARGHIHDLSAKWDAADESYRKALAIKPDASAVHNNRGVSLLMRGQFAGAAAAFQEALRFDPNLATASSNLRVALASQGKYAEALTGVRGADAPATLNNIGFIAMKRGDYPQAESYFAQAMKAAPAYYDKAALNLQYVKQLKDAEAGARAARAAEVN